MPTHIHTILAMKPADGCSANGQEQETTIIAGQPVIRKPKMPIVPSKAEASGCVALLLLALAAFVQLAAAQPGDTSPEDTAQIKTKAERGDAKAQYTLGAAYEEGKGVEQNNDLAFQWYRKAADQGDAQAQNAVGVMYSRGLGVDKNKEEAVRWYQKAARQGDANGMFNLGAAYYNGDGLRGNEETACAWFFLAKEAGSKPGADAVQRCLSEHSPARIMKIKLRLAIMFELGDGVQADAVAAATRYRELLSAPSKDTTILVEAHLGLARLYFGQRGLPRDIRAVREQCEAAASLKSGAGYYCLALLNERGEFGSPDFTEAARLYREAIAYHDYRGMFRLGMLYESGQGVKQNNVEALKWYILALDHRQADAKPAYASLTARLSKKENEKAEKEAREWRRGR